MTLPTFSPESYLYYILKMILDDTRFWQQLESLNLNKDYTSYRLQIILDEVQLDDNCNISNDNLKKVFHGETLSSIKEFIREAQVLNYYYKNHLEDLQEFQNDVQKIFNLVEKRVKASLQ